MGRRIDGSFDRIDVVDLDRVSQMGWMAEMLIALTDPQRIDTPDAKLGGRLEFIQHNPDIIRESRKTMNHGAEFTGGATKE